MIRRVALALFVVAALCSLLSGAVGAHTEVLRAEPGPATEVSGTVGAVTLLFGDAVGATATIVVVDDDGTPVPGLGDAVLSEDARTLTVSFDRLRSSGRYRVTYDYVSAADGHPGGDSYTFTYRATSGIETGTIRLVVAAGVGAVVAAALVLALRHRRVGGD